MSTFNASIRLCVHLCFYRITYLLLLLERGALWRAKINVPVPTDYVDYLFVHYCRNIEGCRRCASDLINVGATIMPG